MLTRRAKVYSSFGSRKVNIQIPNSSSELHNDNKKSQILPTPSHLALSFGMAPFGMAPFEFMEKLYGS